MNDIDFDNVFNSMTWLIMGTVGAAIIILLIVSGPSGVIRIVG